VIRHSYRSQRTIGRPVEVVGTGFLTGATVRLRFLPAAPAAGIVFSRTDLRQRVQVAAHADHITGTERRTTLGQPPAQVGLVEHVLAALAGLRIDNCLVELNATEPPGLDGSSLQFVRALEEAGVCLQPARRPIWAVEEPVVVGSGSATLALHPPENEQLTITYFLDYGPRSPICKQVHTQAITPSSFAQELADCRTFLLEAEALELRSQGLGAQTTTADLLVFGPHGPLDNSLRHANEPARHKILDIIGDLALLGVDLVGHIVACRSGHPLNAELVRALHRAMIRTCQRDRLAA